jgi:hypothetical protein
MSWEAFVPAGVAAAAAAASPAPPGRSEAAPETLSSPMPWMLHVPATVQELAERVGPPPVGTAPIWQLAASSGTLHDPPEKKRKINPDALLANDRWRRKCTRESIVFDMGNGCHCGCVYTLTMQSVLEMREQHMREDQAERRNWTRTFIADNPDPSSQLGVAFHTQEDINQRLCVTGFDVYHGWAKSWTYKHVRNHRAGVTQDDPNWGGARSAAAVLPIGDSLADEDSNQFMSALGWLKGLREDTEIMPNTRERQLDYIEIGELYKEYVQDQKDAGSTDDCISSARLWRRVWLEHFSDLVVREHKAVSGKNRKRGELRRLMRRNVTKNATDRNYLKNVRSEYRQGDRRERGFYWEARLLPGKFPEMYLTSISDGATQADYVLPRMIDLDLNRKCIQMKLVATIYHGHCIVFHVVHPHVPDDSNLVCHCIDTSLEVLVDERKKKDLPDFLPANCRFQLDGVSTNWGLTVFAHLKHLQTELVIGDDVDVCRNEVGSTHEDVDGLFGNCKTEIRKLDVLTPADLDAAIKRAFKDHALPVHILHVDATLDYKSFYQPHINIDLHGFGYSDVQQGYHWLKLSSSMFPEHGAAFKRWQSETKVDVAISRDDLPAMLRPLPTARFLPTLMMVSEPFRPAQLLVTRPTGKPDVAPLIDFDWGQVDRDLSRMVANHSVNEGVKAQLSQWISERPKTMAEASALSSLPRHDARPLRPAFGGMTGGHAVIGRTAAMRAAVRVEGQNRIVNNRVEANALAAENAVNRAARDEVTFLELEAGSFALVQMKYDDPDAGGCQIPLILVELPSVLPAGDSSQASFKVEVKWWEPKPNAAHPQKGTYCGSWRKWMEGRSQASSEIGRDEIAVVGVKFTRVLELAGGLRKFNAATLTKIDGTANSLYADFT